MIEEKVLVGIGAPDCFVLEIIEVLIFGHLVKQFYLDLLIRMSKRTVLAVLAGLFMHEALAVFGLIPGRMI